MGDLAPAWRDAVRLIAASDSSASSAFKVADEIVAGDDAREVLCCVARVVAVALCGLSRVTGHPVDEYLAELLDTER